MRRLVRFVLIVGLLVLVGMVAARAVRNADATPGVPVPAGASTSSPADFIADIPTAPVAAPRHTPPTHCEKPPKNHPTRVVLCHPDD